MFNLPNICSEYIINLEKAFSLISVYGAPNDSTSPYDDIKCIPRRRFIPVQETRSGCLPDYFFTLNMLCHYVKKSDVLKFLRFYKYT